MNLNLKLNLLRPECDWFVYMILHKKSTIPYIGKTNDLVRRLRQHNSEISGGAKRTHKALDDNTKWERVLHIKGFVDERAALHFEYRFQKERQKVSRKFANTVYKNDAMKKGLEALKAVMMCDRPTRAAFLLSDYGPQIVFENEQADALYDGIRIVSKI